MPKNDLVQKGHLPQCLVSMSHQQQLDEHVKHLITQALELNPDSEERSKIIKGLLVVVEHLPHARNENNLDEVWRPYYDQALKSTERDIIRNLEKFPRYYNFDVKNTPATDIRACFVRWYNQTLRFDCGAQRYKARNKPKPGSLDEPIGDGESTRVDRIPDTNNPPPMEQSMMDENRRQQQLLRDYLTFDPEGELRNCHSKTYPHCNCWELAKRRVLKEPNETFQKIAEALEVPMPVVTAHWRRHTSPSLKKIAQRFGFDAE